MRLAEPAKMLSMFLYSLVWSYSLLLQHFLNTFSLARDAFRFYVALVIGDTKDLAWHAMTCRLQTDAKGSTLRLTKKTWSCHLRFVGEKTNRMQTTTEDFVRYDSLAKSDILVENEMTTENNSTFLLLTSHPPTGTELWKSFESFCILLRWTFATPKSSKETTHGTIIVSHSLLWTL